MQVICILRINIDIIYLMMLRINFCKIVLKYKQPFLALTLKNMWISLFLVSVEIGCIEMQFWIVTKQKKKVLEWFWEARI